MKNKLFLITIIFTLILISLTTFADTKEEIEIETEITEVYLANAREISTGKYKMFSQVKNVSLLELMKLGSDYYVPDSNHIQIEYPRELFKGQGIYIKIHQAILNGNEPYTTTINFNNEIEIKELGQMIQSSVSQDGGQVGEFGTSSFTHEFNFNLFNMAEYNKNNSLVFKNEVGRIFDYYFIVFPKEDTLTINIEIIGNGEKSAFTKTFNVIDKESNYTYKIIAGDMISSVVFTNSDFYTVTDKSEKDKILNLAKKYGYNSDLQPSITFETDIALEKEGTYSLDLYGSDFSNKILDDNFFGEEEFTGGTIKMHIKNEHITFRDWDSFKPENSNEPPSLYQIAVSKGGALFKDFDIKYYYPKDYNPEDPDEPEISEYLDVPEGSRGPNNPKTHNNPNDKTPVPKDLDLNTVSKKAIITISIIVILYKLLLTVAPKIPFIPLFYYTRKVPIYSNLKQEDGTIKRRKVFTEPYEVNRTQLIVDITDTMNMYKEYNYLEMEVSKDIAYSVITKVVENKKVKEIIPRTLVVKHKNHKEPIQVVPIVENFYDEKKKAFIIKLEV